MDSPMANGSMSRDSISSQERSATRSPRNHATKIKDKPCAGKSHARIERGIWERARLSEHRTSDYQ